MVSPDFASMMSPDFFNEKIAKETGKIVPLEHWEGNIMAQHFGRVDEQNITGILEFHELIPVEDELESENCKK